MIFMISVCEKRKKNKEELPCEWDWLADCLEVRVCVPVVYNNIHGGAYPHVGLTTF